MSNEKITCQICGAKVHTIANHLKQDHPEMTMEQYQAKWPDAPLMSELAKLTLQKKLAERQANSAAATGVPSAPATVASLVASGPTTKKMFHELFKLEGKNALSRQGKGIPITVLCEHEHQDLVPAVSEDYVFDVDELKNVTMALELNIPVYVWGHKGAGKTQLCEQIAARTNRPLMRVQHTINIEESHIVGQWTVKNGNTVFELGPLPLAMKHGMTYLADEYDFALPSVLSVYQAVLEGKPLVIHGADRENMIIEPHPQFRFMATGNTNGSGDESGLYQGTQLQNSANYDRFGIVVNKKYMAPEQEIQILQKQARLNADDAKKLVDFANKIRESFAAQRMNDTISPRTLIYAARIGTMRADFKTGLELAFMNKLSRVDKATAEGLAQRIFA